MGNCFSLSLSCDTLITHCLDCVAGQCRFVCALEENIDALKTEVEQLKHRKNDVMRRVRTAEEQEQLKRLEEVEGWLSTTETVIKEADLLIMKSTQQINQLCMGGCCSRHPRSSYNFGKHIAKKLREVKNQWSSGDFTTVANKTPLPSVTKRPSEPTVGLASTFNKVWSSLEKEHVGIIGLYGLGGVGKTTLLNQINNRFPDARNDFDYVIWAVVSQDLQIEKVQEEIGKRIGFSGEAWKRKRVDEKAEDIFNVLREKKFALLLDDIWERIELTRVGVPVPPQQYGSKIIFTTRSIDVCSQMEANKKIKVECLPQEEALKLFEKKVGAKTLDSHPKIRELAEAVAEECAGLPLALITIGRAMASKKTPQEWEYAKEVLRQSAASVFPGVGKDMYPILKFSYDCLSDEKVKSCFLYCSLYPEDFLIPRDDLIECWIGEGLIDTHGNCSSVRNQGHFIIRCLVDACLLEEEKVGSIKMHDVIRDMALWIVGEDFFVKAGVQLKELPIKGKWKNARKVSLMDNQIKDLSEIPACPNLQTLLLGKNELELIGTDFFNSMPMLKVLDLSKNFKVKELRVGIATLVSLQHLNLSNTYIRELPIELKALRKLKYLNLEWTTKLKKISQQLISSFSELQVLKMRCCGCNWSVEEIEELKDLEVLTITFKTGSMLERALELYKFKNCDVEGLELKDFSGSKKLNVMDLINLRNLYELILYQCRDVEEVKVECADGGIESAGRFQSLGHVRLYMCSKLRDASWVIFAPHLESLSIEHCGDLEEIVSEEKLGSKLMENSNLFSELQTLSLWDLPKLKRIYGNALPFPHLKEIMIINCPMLKKLPLNSDSAKRQKKMVIQGENKWWNDLEWEDEFTRIDFRPSFNPRSLKKEGHIVRCESFTFASTSM